VRPKTPLVVFLHDTASLLPSRSAQLETENEITRVIFIKGLGNSFCIARADTMDFRLKSCSMEQKCTINVSGRKS
jgi:hypothetical protein